MQVKDLLYLYARLEQYIRGQSCSRLELSSKSTPGPGTIVASFELLIWVKRWSQIPKTFCKHAMDLLTTLYMMKPG